MNTLLHISLFTTEHCHLCEQAELILQRIECPCLIQKIDITENDTLFEKYQYIIPAIRIDALDISLQWPFNEGDINRLIQQSSAT